MVMRFYSQTDRGYAHDAREGQGSTSIWGLSIRCVGSLEPGFFIGPDHITQGEDRSPESHCRSIHSYDDGLLELDERVNKCSRNCGRGKQNGRIIILF